MLRCIAIDDEPLALRQLQGYIGRVEALQLLGTFTSALEARDFVAENEVDLIFVDINMPDLDGLEFVRGLGEKHIERRRPWVVFTTAYAQHAVEGYRLNAIDYLLKPFSLADFKRAVSKALGLQELMKSVTPAPDKEVSAPEKEYLSVRADHKTSLVRIADIVWAESVGEYVKLHIEGQPALTTLQRLKNIEAALPAGQFMRVHRSYIINLSRIRGYARGRVFLADDEGIPIGENYREAFQHYVKGLETPAV